MALARCRAALGRICAARVAQATLTEGPLRVDLGARKETKRISRDNGAFLGILCPDRLRSRLPARGASPMPVSYTHLKAGCRAALGRGIREKTAWPRVRPVGRRGHDQARRGGAAEGPPRRRCAVKDGLVAVSYTHLFPARGLLAPHQGHRQRVPEREDPLRDPGCGRFPFRGHARDAAHMDGRQGQWPPGHAPQRPARGNHGLVVQRAGQMCIRDSPLPLRVRRVPGRIRRHL